jgi:acyl-coenzyme A synthetase/AMP-(fatty) acid ligase
VDQQVKVRGYRIELGEIETVLLSHPAVREAVVLAQEDEGRHKRVVAYLTLRSEVEAPRVDHLREYLASRMPAYMVPSALIVVDEFKRTPSDKIDRLALAALKHCTANAYRRDVGEPLV